MLDLGHESNQVQHLIIRTIFLMVLSYKLFARTNAFIFNALFFHTQFNKNKFVRNFVFFFIFKARSSERFHYINGIRMDLFTNCSEKNLFSRLSREQCVGTYNSLQSSIIPKSDLKWWVSNISFGILTDAKY